MHIATKIKIITLLLLAGMMFLLSIPTQANDTDELASVSLNKQEDEPPAEDLVTDEDIAEEQKMIKLEQENQVETDSSSSDEN